MCGTASSGCAVLEPDLERPGQFEPDHAPRERVELRISKFAFSDGITPIRQIFAVQSQRPSVSGVADRSVDARVAFGACRVRFVKPSRADIARDGRSSEAAFGREHKTRSED